MYGSPGDETGGDPCGGAGDVGNVDCSKFGLKQRIKKDFPVPALPDT